MSFGNEFVKIVTIEVANCANRNGGARITGYIVERREMPSSRWLKCNFSNLSECRYTVTGLTEDMNYEFQIIAKNSAGSVSQPSEPSEMVTCKDTFPPPCLDLEAHMKDTLIATAGESAVLSAAISGKPDPTLTWKCTNTDLENSPKT